jgi:hypothetical protein
VKTIVPLLELLLALISGGLAILLLLGKLRIEIVRRPKVEEPEEEQVVNYVRPLETPQPPDIGRSSQKRKGSAPKATSRGATRTTGTMRRRNRRTRSLSASFHCTT